MDFAGSKPAVSGQNSRGIEAVNVGGRVWREEDVWREIAKFRRVAEDAKTFGEDAKVRVFCVFVSVFLYVFVFANVFCVCVCVLCLCFVFVFC